MGNLGHCLVVGGDLRPLIVEQFSLQVLSLLLVSVAGLSHPCSWSRRAASGGPVSLHFPTLSSSCLDSVASSWVYISFSHFPRQGGGLLGSLMGARGRQLSHRALRPPGPLRPW